MLVNWGRLLILLRRSAHGFVLFILFAREQHSKHCYAGRAMLGFATHF